MLKYILKRLAFAIPTLFTVSIVIFALYQNAPSDPAAAKMDDETNAPPDAQSMTAYLRRRHELRLDLPVFYVALAPLSQSDTLYKIPRLAHRQTLRRLTDACGNWVAVQDYYRACNDFQLAAARLPLDSSNADALTDTRKIVAYLYLLPQTEAIRDTLAHLAPTLAAVPALLPSFEQLNLAFAKMQQQPTRWKNYVPTLRWYGFNNQYHVWVFGNRPWWVRRKSVLAVSPHALTQTPTTRTFATFKNGFYEIVPTFRLLENNGLRTDKDVERLPLFELTINGKTTDYSLKTLAEANFLHQATDTQTRLSWRTKPLAATYRLRFEGEMQVAQRLNYDPNKTYGGFIRFDFGNSSDTHQPVWLRLKGALFWTGVLSLLSLVLTFLIAVPLGVFSARRSGSRADAVVSTVLFVLYSMPNFWIATLLILFFGEQLGWFPIFGVGEVAENATWWQTLEVRAKHLVLPLICWTYPSLAFLSRQMRGSMLEQLQQEFIKTARAKGLTEGKVMWRHAFRNSLLPIITILGDVLPSLVAGSIVIETIFSINGMGQLLLQAIAAKDFPILFAVVLLTALLTFIGHLCADLLYGWANPRVREQ